MLITPAYAQAAAGGDANSMLMSLLPFALIFVIMYFLILRPQQKKVKDHAELVKNIRRGDTVITSGGLVGKVTKVVDDDQIEFEISDGVRVRQMRQMISGVRTKGERFNGLREWLSTLMYADNIQKPTTAELEEAHHHADHELALQGAMSGQSADGHQFDGHGTEVNDDNALRGGH